jgi:molybdopterin synthase catalytic subunit/rhodanese-related sulfurtransferase
MFELSDQPIQAQDLAVSATGAQVVFTGIVRDHNEGRTVKSLEYEAMPTVALKEGNAIIEEAKRLFDVQDVHCTHRTGALQIGETAVVVTATSAHRQAAFAACQYVIEEVKKRVPIWKRETYADGTIEWVNAVEHPTNGIAVLLECLEDFQQWTVIDVRDDDERQAEPIERVAHLASPSGQFDRGLLAKDGAKTLLVCASGVRALLLADDLMREGHKNVHALTGGFVTLRLVSRKRT